MKAVVDLRGGGGERADSLGINPSVPRIFFVDA